MSSNLSGSASSNVQAVPGGSGDRPLIDDADAWRLVLQCAEGKLEFIQLSEELSTRFRERYDYNDWSSTFTELFAAWEEETADGPVGVVKRAMFRRGVSLSGDSRGASASGSASTDTHRTKRRRVASGAQACRFLDMEAHVDEAEEETSGEEEENDPFIVPDDAHEGRAMAPSHPRFYSTSATAGPSRYSQAINTIAQRYERMSPEVEDGVDEDEDEDMVILDTAGIWEIIRDWIAGTLHYETLLRHIDFQYEKYAELQYWEDFISDLAFESSVEKREAHFNSITLDQHRHSLSQYPPPAIPLQMSSPSPLQSPARISTPLDSAEVVSMWAVKILPVSSAPYILASWNRVGLSAMPQHKLLPGRVTVCAADPNTFLREVPKSHFGCVKAWSLVPVEDRINLFGAVEPSVPGWYTISKRGLYKGHIGYALFYDGDAGLLDLLVASRRLGDPTRRRADGSIGQDQRAPRLFLPGPHKGTRQPPHRGRTCYEYKGDTYVSGLLLISLKISEVQPLAIPSPHQIALHVQSGVDPVFMTASHHLYNQQFWKEHDSVVVCDAAHRGKRGVLQTISLETRSATVQLLEGGEWFIALSDLQRYYTAGDVVRIIEDPHSNIQNVHHQVIGKFGNVIDVDVDTGEVTLLDSTSSEEIRIPPFLLESYVPDQAVLAARCSIVPSIEDSPDVIQVGDTAQVKSGPHTGMQGIVEFVQHTPGIVRLRCLVPSCHIHVPISSVTFTPPVAALRFSAARNYDVRTGESVVVVRGNYIGRSGVVSKVDLDRKTLDVASTWNPSVVFTLPITHFAHADVVCDRDDENRYRGKEVLIIRGEYKGWRGILRSKGNDSCDVEIGATKLATLKADVVVVRGCDSTLGGTALTPQQCFNIESAFTAAIRQEATRMSTPPPTSPHLLDGAEDAGTSSNPWRVDDDDLAEADPPASSFNFLLRPRAVESLKIYHAVFRITPGWRDSYLNRHAKTEVPSPFQSPSGQPVPVNSIAVFLTERTKGAQPLHVNIPERSLAPTRPSKKNTLCMVIEGKEGGEEVGEVLSVTKCSKKEEMVEVKRLDNTPSNESTLPWSRVVLVEKSF